MKLLPGGECGVLAFAAPAGRLILGGPTFISHYWVLRTRGTTCDTYKWLAFTVCLRRSCFWAWPDGLWSTLTRCSMTIAQGPCLLFIWITRGGKCSITQSASRNTQNCVDVDGTHARFRSLVFFQTKSVKQVHSRNDRSKPKEHILNKSTKSSFMCSLNGEQRWTTNKNSKVIHAVEGGWCKRSLNVNAPVIQVVVILRLWQLSMHQSQPCVSRGEPTSINLEPEVIVWVVLPPPLRKKTNILVICRM